MKKELKDPYVMSDAELLIEVIKARKILGVLKGVSVELSVAHEYLSKSNESGDLDLADSIKSAHERAEKHIAEYLAA